MRWSTESNASISITRCYTLKINKTLVSSVATSGEAMLPTIRAEILGSQNVKKQVNLLLDTGTQIRLIRTSVTEELGLKGKNVTITMAKVGGEEDKMATKLYRFSISFP
jgi:hypothetical protein